MGHRCLPAMILMVLAPLAHAYPTAQIQYSWPLRLGGELGVNFFDFSGFVTEAGPFASASAGRDGVGLNAGVKGSIMMIVPLATAGISASSLYLWEGSDAAYIGARGMVSIRLISVFGGAYRRISGERSDDWLFSIGTGLGLP